MVYIVGILGTYSNESNTEIVLDYVLEKLRGYKFICEKIKLINYKIEPCRECKLCRKAKKCVINDDMTNIIIPKLLSSHVIIVASPVFFENITSITKLFMDRTWCIKGLLKDKILGSIVVGKGYGLDFALKTIHNWGIMHQMIIGDMGVIGRGFNPGEIINDPVVFRNADKHVSRIVELLEKLRVV